MMHIKIFFCVLIVNISFQMMAVRSSLPTSLFRKITI